MSHLQFDGRVAVVTGAGNGLGRAHALELAKRGAKVVVNDLGGAVDGSGQSGQAADLVVDEIRKAGGTAVANYDSVSTEAGGANIIKTALDNFGTIDILINNAGILRDKSFHKMTLDEYRLVVDVHLMGAVYCTFAAWPIFREKNYGRVIMTTSSAGLYGNFGQCNYGAAKLALVGLMNCLKQEGTKSGILVNAISPVAETRLASGIFPPQVAPFIKPELVTPAAIYLASEACNQSGQVIICGAGHFAAARMEETAGVQFSPTAAVSAEDFAAEWANITNFDGAQPHNDAMQSVGKLFAAFQKKMK